MRIQYKDLNTEITKEQLLEVLEDSKLIWFTSKTEPKIFVLGLERDLELTLEI